MSIPKRDYTGLRNFLPIKVKCSLLFAEILQKYKYDGLEPEINLSDYLGVAHASKAQSFRQFISYYLSAEDLKNVCDDGEDMAKKLESNELKTAIFKLTQGFQGETEINLNAGTLKWRLREIGIADEETFQKIWNDLREFIPFLIGRELDVNSPFYSTEPPAINPQSPTPPV